MSSAAPASGSGASGRPHEGIVVVDKPGGMTSHDVVARMRRLAGTRRVGHAGTLDPMATGVLVTGIGRATRMLGHIAGSDKTYAATIRLGWATVTDDAEGLRLGGAPADRLDEEALAAEVQVLTGAILQRPSSVSAIKVRGQRSHERVRAGVDVQLPERPVVVSQFDVLALRREADQACLDLDAVITCSSGTYVRALARDLGAALGVGGHLTSLRRRRVGCFDLSQAHALPDLEQDLASISMGVAARAAFPSVSLTDADANAVRHGRAIHLGAAWQGPRQASPGPTAGRGDAPGDSSRRDQRSPDVHALFAADGEFLALAQPRPDGSAAYLAVFSQP